MRYLLDTHIWVWSALEPERLRPRVARRLRDPRNELWLSPISVWETLLLAEKGLLVLEPTAPAWIAAALEGYRFRAALLTHDIAIESRHIHLPHQDPADRFLAATARVLELTLVTADQRLISCRDVRTLANR